MDRAFAAFAVDDREFARTRQHDAAVELVDDHAEIAILDRAVRNRFEVRLLVELRRAADVEGTHRKLRARFTDRLRRDDANGLTDIDRRTAGEIAPVALAADALRSEEHTSELQSL